MPICIDAMSVNEIYDQLQQRFLGNGEMRCYIALDPRIESPSRCALWFGVPRGVNAHQAAVETFDLLEEAGAKKLHATCFSAGDSSYLSVINAHN